MKNKKKKVETLVHFILDSSGSMETILGRTISGFNEYLMGLKKDKNPIRFSLTLFSTLETKSPYINVPVKMVKPLNSKTYNPNGGTPLYDAVVDSVEELVARIGNKKQPVAVVIMTDGEENSSYKHDQKCLKDLIEKLQGRGNWTFAYMGANQDAWDNAQKIGITKGNTLGWASTNEGTDIAFYSLSAATRGFSKAMVSANGTGADLKSSNFFSNEDKIKGGV